MPRSRKTMRRRGGNTPTPPGPPSRPDNTPRGKTAFPPTPTAGSRRRKMTRRRRGGMFGMKSGLSQAEKDAIAKRTTYGDLPADAVATVKDYGTEGALKQNALSEQMKRGYTGYNKGKSLAKNILARTGRRA